MRKPHFLTPQLIREGKDSFMPVLRSRITWTFIVGAFFIWLVPQLLPHNSVLAPLAHILLLCLAVLVLAGMTGWIGEIRRDLRKAKVILRSPATREDFPQTWQAHLARRIIGLVVRFMH